MSDADRQRVENELGHGRSGPGALDEQHTPPTDEVREAKDRDWSDVAGVHVDPRVLRDGGPTRTPGMMTTTGGNAGPNSVKRRPVHPEGVKIAPTTTGDATTGGMQTPVRSSTSDASSAAASAGNFADDE